MSCSEEPPTNINNESLSKKPTPPNPPEPLVLLHNANQIVGCSGSKIVVWTYSGGIYSVSWENSSSGDYNAAAIGDVDRDGNDELVAVFIYETGRGRNKITHKVIQIFENGDTDTPTRVSGDLTEEGVNGIGYTYMRLGDANNDGHIEILIAHSNCISVHNDNGSEIPMLWKSEDLSALDPWSIEAGDADNDGQNEIVYAELAGQRFGVYEYVENNTWGNRLYSETILYGLDRAFVADVDGDGLNEVIGGGNASMLFVWEYINGNYVVEFESGNLGGFTQGIGSGDFDNDELNEIAVGTAGADNKVIVFKHNGTTYLNIYEDSFLGMVSDLFAGDSDNDGVKEIVLAASDLLVYDYTNQYNQTYSNSTGIFQVIVK